MTTTEAALPLIEALALLREEAVRNGHDMAPALQIFDSLWSVCARCGGGCATYGQGNNLKFLRQSIDRPCEPTKGEG